MLGVVTAIMALSVMACTPTTERNITSEDNIAAMASIAATNGVADEKYGDADAPQLEIVSIYIPNEDGSSMTTKIESIEELTPQALVDLLIQHGVLEEGTESISFEAVGTPEEAAVGPGVVIPPEGFEVVDDRVDTGILDLNQLPDDEAKIAAVTQTFLENMKAIKLTIQVNGETVVE